MRTDLLLMNNQSLLTGLKHNLTFATDSQINKAILQRFQTYETLYEDNELNRSLLEDTVTRWSDYFNQLAKTRGWTDSATIFKYDPIENYRRNESEESTRTPNLSTINDSTRTPDLETVTKGDGEAEDVRNSSGYNTSNYTPTDKTKGTTKNNSATTQSGTDKVHTENVETGEDKNERSLLAYGNIGTMTTQEMITQERGIIINIISDYVDKFAEDFAVTI